MSNKKVSNGGGGEKTGYLFEKRFSDLMVVNSMKHHWNKSINNFHRDYFLCDG